MVKRKVTKVIDGGKVDVGPLMPVLRTLVSVYGHMAQHSQSNSLILIAPYSTIKRIEGIIKQLNLAITNQQN